MVIVAVGGNCGAAEAAGAGVGVGDGDGDGDGVCPSAEALKISAAQVPNAM